MSHIKKNVLPDGRNFIPVANSSAKCLLENWVEERAVEPIDAEQLKMRAKATSMAQVLKNGHRGLLTTNFCATTKDLTSHLDAYRPSTGPGIRTIGTRTELMQQMFLERVLADMEREQNPPPEPDDEVPKSVTQKDFNLDDFIPRQPAPYSEHDYRKEEPVTFWSEHRDKIHGVSQIKPTFNSVFRKNSAFSRPIDETWEPTQAKPYEHDHYPNM